MKIKILGSGTILSPQIRNQAGYILQNKTAFFLIDIGPGILKQMIIAGYDVLKIDAVIISHFHSDHCADLLPFLLRRYLLDKQANRRLKIFGPQGLKVWFAGQSVFQSGWLMENLPELIEFKDENIECCGLQAQAILNGHTENSISLFFSGEKKLFYSSDTGFNRGLVPFAKGADAAIMECSMPDGAEVEGHLTPSKSGILVSQAAIKKLIITHIYPENDTADLKSRVAEYFSGEIIIAKDFLEIEL